MTDASSKLPAPSPGALDARSLPPVPPPAPISHGFRGPPAPMRWLGWLWLRAFGWRVPGRPPDPPVTRAVVIAVPHTSNWDFPHAIAICWYLGIQPRWLGKHTLFAGFMGPVFRALGGIPVDRRAAHGLVAQVAQQIRDNDGYMVLVPPEGSRSARPYWKSGFYRIAQEAGVPVVLGFLDYRRRVGGFDRVMWPSGDLVADMAILRDYYKDHQGKDPTGQGPIRVREEDDAQR